MQIKLTASVFETEYGRSITPKELGKFLGLDPRSLIKYADRWGGVEVFPGTWRFFENRVKEVLDAELDNCAREKEIPRHCDGKGRTKRQTVSRRQQGFDEGSGGMGENEKSGAKKRPIRNTHGINFN